jgi:hypothetical protein
MAKDPAFLFYTSDFLVGTITMTNEQVGKYIRLLCLQHQKGRLTEQDFDHFQAKNDNAILQKFISEDGSYYNERLYQESEKRKKHSEHQKMNAKKRWQCQTDAKPMPNVCDGNAIAMPLENENENENENRNVNVLKGGAGGKMKVPAFEEVNTVFEEKGHPDQAEKFFNYYEANGWRVGRNPMKNWKAAVNNWIKNQEIYAADKKRNGNAIAKNDYAAASAKYDFDRFGDIPVSELFNLPK